MKRHYYFLIALFLFIFYSCKEEGEKIIESDIVYAGVYEASYIHHEFNPPLKIKTELDSVTWFSSGKDSIDLDLDGNFDLIISVYLHPNDTAYEIGSKRFFPSCRLLFKNNFEVAIKGFQYACGHGICNYAPFIESFEYNTDINHFEFDWYLGNENKTLWLITPEGSGYPRGWWYYANEEERYIGIRIKEQINTNTYRYRYGWIKVNAINRNDMSVTEYALEQAI